MAYRLDIKKSGHNFFGDGSDGAVTISSNTDLTSVTDGEYVIKQYSSLTVDVGATLSVLNRCKGLIIYVQGACVLNGLISMSGKGPNLVSATDGLIYRYYPDSAGVRGLITEFLSAATGGSGGAGVSSNSNGNTGNTATNGTGGGGSGARGGGGTSGSGGVGTCYAGGSGGGGAAGASGTSAVGSGPGGNAGGTAGGGGHGGTGNPGGAGSGSSGLTGTDGNGGLLLLIVGGNLTIGASGGLSANGVNASGGSGASGGGGSGGGRIGCFYAGTLSNSGALTATGGAGGIASRTGGAGGNGSVTGPIKIAL